MRDWARRALRLPPAVLIILFVGVVRIILTPALPPSFLLDSDWPNGVDLAILHGKQFGVAINFTAGPLANLDETSILSASLYIPAVLATTVTGLVIAFLSWRFARTWLPRVPSALVVTLLIVPSVVYADIFSARVLLLSVMCALGLLTGAIDRRWVRAILIVLSVASALALLAKSSNGTLSIATVVLIAVMSTEGHIIRRAITAIASLLISIVSIVLFWLLAGQQLAHLPAWIAATLQLTSGYAEAMSTDYRELTYQYVVLALVTVVVVVQALTRRGANRWWLLILVVWIVVAGVRLGFTRHDLGHATETFTLLAVVALGLGATRQLWLALSTVVVTVATLFSSVTIYAGMFNPVTVAGKARAEVLTMFSASYREDVLAEARQAGQKQYGLSPQVLAALRGKAIHVDPIEVNAAWSYSLDWHPVPVFQTYAAFTPALDKMNEQSLLSASGPDAVLRGALTAIDARNPMWESPLYMKALVCNFAPTVTSKHWQVLDRASNRCGAPAQLSSQKFSAGETVTVPKAPGAGYMIVASLSTDNSVLNAFATQVFKPFKKVVVKTNQGDFRLPRAHEGGPLILELPKTAGWAAPFGGQTNVKSFTVSESGSVVFSAIRIAPAN